MRIFGGKSPVEKRFTDLDGRTVVHLRGREAAVDIGNAEIKAVLGSERSRMSIPNVISEINFDGLLEVEDNILEGIRVQIDSPVLTRKWGTLAVGKLAARQAERIEVEPGSNKSETDQSFILLFVMLALDAVKHFKVEGGTVKATYFLSTGLPIHEYKNKELRQAFKNKLKNGIHKVKFLEVAEPYNDIEVQLYIYEVKLNSEGKAAHARLLMDEFGRPRNLPGTNGAYMINDDGGGTIDTAIILEGGRPDNERSQGDRALGINDTLDKVISDLRSKFGTDLFESRKELSDHLLQKKDPLSKSYPPVFIKGKPTSINDIVHIHLQAYARRVYEYMKRKWREVARLQACYFIGGAAALIRPYLVELNKGEANGEYSIYFLDSNESFWLLTEAYYLAGKHYQARNKKQKIVLLPPA